MRRTQTRPTCIVPGQALGVVASNNRDLYGRDHVSRSYAPHSLPGQPHYHRKAWQSVQPSAQTANPSCERHLEVPIQQVEPRSLPDREEEGEPEKSPRQAAIASNFKPEARPEGHRHKRRPSDALVGGYVPPVKVTPPKHQAPSTEPQWRAYDHALRLHHSKKSAASERWWTPERKREAFARIRFNLDNHLEIGCDEQRAQLANYVSETRTQGLYVTGSSPEPTNFLVRALLRSLSTRATAQTSPETIDIIHVDAEFYNTPSKVYDVIRGRLKCRWDFPRWRSVKEYVKYGRTVPPVSSAIISVVVVENIDAQIKSLTSKLATLDDLLRFLNMHVRDRGLKFILTGHDAKTVRRFSTAFGGFVSAEVDKYVYRMPGWTFKSLATHLELVAANALVPMGEQAHLSDVIATQAFQLAAQKALKHGRCELEPVVMVMHKAIRMVLSKCRHLSLDYEADEAKWKVDYTHVAAAATVFFEHDYVSRIRCLGTYPKALLLILIDAGPCTEEELIHRINERQKNHVWILILTSHNREWFNTSLDLLLYVPVVKVRDIVEFRGDKCYTLRKYYALPSREHLIAAAGSDELIKLIL